MVLKLKVEKILSDSEMESREGEYFDESHYTHILKEDADVYKSDGTLLLKVRRKVISPQYYQGVADALRDISIKKHDNRGASAGMLDWKKMPNYVGGWLNQKKFRTNYTQQKSGQRSKHYISNLSPSNIIGYFEKKDRNKPNGPPCRLTAFSLKEPGKWKTVIPFVQQISNLFRTFVPHRYSLQLERAKISDNYRITNTCFSTLTVNYSWRTACHKDKGDYEEGFGNLIVCEDPENPNTFQGCYLGFPQYGVCVEVRQGDFLAMDVHEWHCNTEFHPDHDSLIPFHKFKEKDFENHWCFNRISMVCYLRKNMIKCTN